MRLLVSVDNLLAAIETARAQPLNRVFCALGVRGTGRTMSRRIAAHFGGMAAMRAADGTGTEKARMVVAEFTGLAPVLDKLTAAGAGR